MLLRSVALVAAAAVMLFAFWSHPAPSRQWKATPQALARDYATINDTRSNGELVLMLWFVPGMISPDASNRAAVVAMLQKYVVIMAVHAHVDKATLAVSFEEINELEARDQNGKSLSAVARDNLSPLAAATVSSLEAVFRQSLGAMGKGTKLFVFDAGDVDSCKKGQLLIPLANESYTWDTPIPGCQQN